MIPKGKLNEPGSVKTAFNVKFPFTAVLTSRRDKEKILVTELKVVVKKLTSNPSLPATEITGYPQISMGGPE